MIIFECRLQKDSGFYLTSISYELSARDIQDTYTIFKACLIINIPYNFNHTEVIDSNLTISLTDTDLQNYVSNMFNLYDYHYTPSASSYNNRSNNDLFTMKTFWAELRFI